MRRPSNVLVRAVGAASTTTTGAGLALLLCVALVAICFGSAASSTRAVVGRDVHGARLERACVVLLQQHTPL